MVKNPRVYIPVDLEAAVKAGRISPEEARVADPAIVTDLQYASSLQGMDGMPLNTTLSLDMIATSMKNGWNRPIYFAMTVPDDYYLGLSPYMRMTGLAYEVTPLYTEPYSGDPTGVRAVDTDRAYRNITERFRWGGLDTAKPGSLYRRDSAAHGHLCAYVGARNGQSTHR